VQAAWNFLCLHCSVPCGAAQSLHVVGSRTHDYDYVHGRIRPIPPRLQVVASAMASSGALFSDTATEVAAGGAAGVAAWASIYPVDVVKSRAQARREPAWAVWRALRAEGGGAMWRGLSATLLRAFAVNGALFWGVGAARRALEAPS
jgi:Mitochondrial carrier protein